MRLATTEDTPGAIIQYASGQTITMTYSKFDFSAPPSVTGAVLGFGNSASGLNVTTNPITNPILHQFAGSLPRAGTLTSISASFINTTPIQLATIIKAQLYIESGFDNSFSPIPGAVVSLSLPVSASSLLVRGITTDLNVPLAAQTRLVMAFFYDGSVNGFFGTLSVTGSASAGITIK